MHHLDSNPRTGGETRVAVVIPTLNEADNLRRLLPQLQAMRGVSQIVVSDGGSRDDTARIAQAFDVTLAALPAGATPNRGAQLVAGAAMIEKNIDALWFLHADARPHPQSAREIGRALRDPRIIGGNFRLRFDSVQSVARAFELIARLQRSYGVYYGDSGLWVRREIYQTLGGFRAWPLFEDYEFARRLEALARRDRCQTVCLRLPLIASSRRFERQPWRVLRLWLLLQARFSLGAHPETLAALYRREG